MTACGVLLTRQLLPFGRGLWRVLTVKSCYSTINDEVRLAQEASKKYGKLEPTIFMKIIDKTVPAVIIHEDDKCLAFRDVNPQAPVHYLVIPRIPIPRISEAHDEDSLILGHLLVVAKNIAKKEGLAEGYRVGLQGNQLVVAIKNHRKTFD